MTSTSEPIPTRKGLSPMEWACISVGAVIVVLPWTVIAMVLRIRWLPGGRERDRPHPLDGLTIVAAWCVWVYLHAPGVDDLAYGVGHIADVISFGIPVLRAWLDVSILGSLLSAPLLIPAGDLLWWARLDDRSRRYLSATAWQRAEAAVVRYLLLHGRGAA